MRENEYEIASPPARSDRREWLAITLSIIFGYPSLCLSLAIENLGTNPHTELDKPQTNTYNTCQFNSKGCEQD